MIRSSRRHGHFDPRYGPFAEVSHNGREFPDRLEWPAFSRSFPSRHRHDLEALEAYGRYRHVEGSVPRGEVVAG